MLSKLYTKMPGVRLRIRSFRYKSNRPVRIKQSVIFVTILVCVWTTFLYINNNGSVSHMQERDDTLYFDNELDGSDDVLIQNLFNEFNANPVRDWQPVETVNSSSKFHVYSAYYSADESSNKSRLRIVGACRTKPKISVRCQLFDSLGKRFAVVKGTARAIKENWNLRYSACFVTCYLPKKIQPRFVSVSETIFPSSWSWTQPSNMLPVQYSTEKRLLPLEFSVCVKPMYNYNNPARLLEWMEFHLLMGVEHFTFYSVNNTVHPDIKCIVENVYKKEQITVLPWTLPYESVTEIRTHGIFAALNDCVLRYRGFSKYLVIVDLDEMIVPRGNTTNYSELVAELEAAYSNHIGSFNFKSAFFFMQWDDDEEVKNNTILSKFLLRNPPAQDLVTIRKTKRTSFYRHETRSKYICYPDRVAEAGNHFIWKYEPGFGDLFVNESLASVNHYRECDNGICEETDHIFVDKTAHAFAQKLTKTYSPASERFADICVLNKSFLPSFSF